MSSGFETIGPDWAMCQLCFEVKDIGDLYRDDEGSVWDVCKECKKPETSR